jgi:hypothetical protein
MLLIELSNHFASRFVGERRPDLNADKSSRDSTAAQVYARPWRRHMIGRYVIAVERASANYCMRQVRRRRNGEVSWEVVDRGSGVIVAAGLDTRDEALRLVRSYERLSQQLEGGLEGHILVH